MDIVPLEIKGHPWPTIRSSIFDHQRSQRNARIIDSNQAICEILTFEGNRARNVWTRAATKWSSYSSCTTWSVRRAKIYGGGKPGEYPRLRLRLNGFEAALYSIRTLAALVFNFTRAWMFRLVLTHLSRYALQFFPLRNQPRTLLRHEASHGSYVSYEKMNFDAIGTVWRSQNLSFTWETWFLLSSFFRSFFFELLFLLFSQRVFFEGLPFFIVYEALHRNLE